MRKGKDKQNDTLTGHYLFLSSYWSLSEEVRGIRTRMTIVWYGNTWWTCPLYQGRWNNSIWWRKWKRCSSLQQSVRQRLSAFCSLKTCTRSICDESLSRRSNIKASSLTYSSHREWSACHTTKTKMKSISQQSTIITCELFHFFVTEKEFWFPSCGPPWRALTVTLVLIKSGILAVLFDLTQGWKQGTGRELICLAALFSWPQMLTIQWFVSIENDRVTGLLRRKQEWLAFAQKKKK